MQYHAGHHSWVQGHNHEIGYSFPVAIFIIAVVFRLVFVGGCAAPGGA
ncbi:YoaK family small membrane protein [Klebsiella pneumoniae]|uniref:YoaK family small membrane protein n=1 Tax=Klebsiella pneumoniae TaxID=573 RepID=A0A939SQ90_KLEPN|nr:YoaK family small membrane protein [Klebsiella pneumoniae]